MQQASSTQLFSFDLDHHTTALNCPIISMKTKQVQKLEKLMAREARMDEKNLKNALRELKKAEKVHEKSVKSTQRARKEVTKSLKFQNKTSEEFDRANRKYDEAWSQLKQAEESLKMRRDEATMKQQEVEQLQGVLSDVERAKIQNDEEREQRLASAIISIRQRQIARASVDTSRVTTGIMPTEES